MTVGFDENPLRRPPSGSMDVTAGVSCRLGVAMCNEGGREDAALNADRLHCRTSAATTASSRIITQWVFTPFRAKTTQNAEKLRQNLLEATKFRQQNSELQDTDVHECDGAHGCMILA